MGTEGGKNVAVPRVGKPLLFRETAGEGMPRMVTGRLMDEPRMRMLTGAEILKVDGAFT